MSVESKSTAPLIRYLPGNPVGRDFVVGDLHGCRQRLDRLLGRAAFDPAADRLFSVGDLVDRGPDSMGCLALLQEPWFHAVRGNHEDMLLDFVWDAVHYGVTPKPKSAHAFLQNGGEWVLREVDEDGGCLSKALTKALAAVRRLPLLLVVGEGTGRFHVVHTDLYQAGESDEVLRDADIDALAQEWNFDVSARRPADLPYAARRWLWSRVIMGRLDRERMPERVPGLSTTYCGHTIAASVRRALSHVCIDTGAFLVGRDATDFSAHGLTMIDAHTGTCSFSPD